MTLVIWIKFQCLTTKTLNQHPPFCFWTVIYRVILKFQPTCLFANFRFSKFIWSEVNCLFRTGTEDSMCCRDRMISFMAVYTVLPGNYTTKIFQQFLWSCDVVDWNFPRNPYKVIFWLFFFSRACHFVSMGPSEKHRNNNKCWADSFSNNRHILRHFHYKYTL